MNKDIEVLKNKTFFHKQSVSIEQALIITKYYQKTKEKSLIIKRAEAFKKTCQEINISIEKEELIVGNRTSKPRDGVVFPESGCAWVKEELNTIDKRPQDKFLFYENDKKIFQQVIYPYWKDLSLESKIKDLCIEELNSIFKVVKINQTDHAQGHICPDTKTWLELGPNGLLKKVKKHLEVAMNCTPKLVQKK